MKNIVILGSTGSVGTQAADVAQASGYRVAALSAHNNVRLVEEQARRFAPVSVCMTDESAAADLRSRLADTDIKVYSGNGGHSQMIADTDCDCFVNSVSGFSGLQPTLDVIASGKRLALANKESLVIAGDIVMERARSSGVMITPVDSEHSAIFQCLTAGKHEEIKRILLTASGGPFFGKTREELKKIQVRDALAHPNWSMGAEITIDSATLMNKGFELIEASKLFDVPGDNIKVLVHRESIVHSMIEYRDNAVIAQLSVPDMRLCVQYAVEYPDRRPAVINELDLCRLSCLHFAEPDTDTFSPLRLAREALNAGGALPAVLHAANEQAVRSFLSERIGFTDIIDTLEHTVAQCTDAKTCVTLEEILEADKRARSVANDFISKTR